MKPVPAIVLFAVIAIASVTLGEVAPLDPDKAVRNDRPSVDEPVVVEAPVDMDDSVADTVLGFTAPTGSFMHGFVATFCVIIVSELGDKTFFIAAIMAMRHSRLTVVTGAISALAIMHVMSAFFGALALKIVPKVYTFYISSFLFAIFGLKMLKEGWNMSAAEAQEEMEEVQEELLKKEKELPGSKDVETGGGDHDTASISKLKRLFEMMISPIFVQAFTMTFLAEWGDRSQLATIVLAAREDITAIIIAGIIGHSICTGLAVLGGRFIAQKISVRTVTLIGGVVFLIFAFTAFFMDPEGT